MRPDTPRPQRFSDLFIVTTFVVGAVAILAAVASGPRVAAVFAFLGVLAIAGIILGFIGWGRGGLPSFFLASRGRSGLALGGGVLVALVALGGLGAGLPAGDEVAPTTGETSLDARRLADTDTVVEPDPAPSSPVPTVSTPTSAMATREATERIAIPFGQMTIEDGSMAAGTTEVRVAGVDGVLERIYRVTSRDGREVDRDLVAEVVVTAAVDEVTAIGTRREQPRSGGSGSGCHSSYTPCVPIASDVDCAGGGGNGPAYVSGPIRVVGPDVYGLDRDGDGIACE